METRTAGWTVALVAAAGLAWLAAGASTPDPVVDRGPISTSARKSGTYAVPTATVPPESTDGPVRVEAKASFDFEPPASDSPRTDSSVHDRWEGTVVLLDAVTGESARPYGKEARGEFVSEVHEGDLFNSNSETKYFRPDSSSRYAVDGPNSMTGWGGVTTYERTGSTPEPVRPVTKGEGWLTIRLPGYSEKRIPHPENGEEVEVRMDRWVPSARGLIEVPDREDPKVAVFLHGPKIPEGVARPWIVHPGPGPGPIEFIGLPEGEYELGLRATGGGEDLWCVRRFQVHGATEDLGRLLVDRSARLRLRVVDLDGVPFTGESFEVVDVGPPEPGWALVEGSDRVAVPDEYTPPDGDQGWTEFRGLAPGWNYEIRTVGPCPVSQVIATSAEPGGTGQVLLVRKERPIHVVLRFVRGDQPVKMNSWLGGRSVLPASGWKGTGVWEGDLFPGRYTAYCVESCEASESGVGNNTLLKSIGFETPSGDPREETVDVDASTVHADAPKEAEPR